MTNDLLTADELAARLRLRPDTIRSWARRSLIPAIRLSPKVIRFDQAAVVKTLTARRARREVVRD